MFESTCLSCDDSTLSCTLSCFLNSIKSSATPVLFPNPLATPHSMYGFSNILEEHDCFPRNCQNPFVCLSVYLAVCLSICLFIHLCPYIYDSKLWGYCHLTLHYTHLFSSHTGFFKNTVGWHDVSVPLTYFHFARGLLPASGASICSVTALSPGVCLPMQNRCFKPNKDLAI